MPTDPKVRLLRRADTERETAYLDDREGRRKLAFAERKEITLPRVRFLERLDREHEWRAVVLASDCDADGNCPRCGIDYAECPCPGPTQDGFEYRVVKGELQAREVQP